MTQDDLPAGWQKDVLGFWFEEIDQSRWFESDAGFDATIRERFGALHETISRRKPSDLRGDADTTLAAIIVLDQFSRNIHRGTAQAFAADDLSVSLTRDALDRGLDRDLDDDHRKFLYMPLMHSEVMADQERCVDLFRSIGAEDSVRFAEEHRDIIATHGRFPHRNRVLGRETTPAEAKFLAGHEGFGQ